MNQPEGHSTEQRIQKPGARKGESMSGSSAEWLQSVWREAGSEARGGAGRTLRTFVCQAKGLSFTF